MIREQATAGRPPRLGRRLYEGHPAWPTMLAIKLGVAYTVGRASAEPIAELRLADFGRQHKRRFPPAGSAETAAHAGEDFTFKDYAPSAFRQLREHFGVSAAEYVLSVCGEHPLRELGNPGKSGCSFYLTHDSRFLIKTVSKKECKFLRAALPMYYTHVLANGSTLLPRFFGLLRITGGRGDKQRLVLMNNLLPERYSFERYDLKGSSLGRAATPRERSDPLGVRKDRDFEQRLRLPEDLLGLLREQLGRDAAWLQKLHVMDYSLLVGLHWPHRAEGPELRACADLDPSGPDTDDEPWESSCALPAAAIAAHGSAAAASAALAAADAPGVGLYRAAGPCAFQPDAELWHRQRPWAEATLPEPPSPAGWAEAATPARRARAVGGSDGSGGSGGGNGGGSDGARVRQNGAGGAARRRLGSPAGARSEGEEAGGGDGSGSGGDAPRAHSGSDSGSCDGGPAPRDGRAARSRQGGGGAAGWLRERPVSAGSRPGGAAERGASLPGARRPPRRRDAGFSDSGSDEAPAWCADRLGGIPPLFRPVSSAGASSASGSGGGPGGSASSALPPQPLPAGASDGRRGGGRGGSSLSSLGLSARTIGIGSKASAPVEVPLPTAAELRLAFAHCQASQARQAAQAAQARQEAQQPGSAQASPAPAGARPGRRSPRDVSVFHSDDGGFRCVNAKGEAVRVCCGLIDILQQYTQLKRMEHAYKAARWFAEKDGISVVSPDKYALRFQAFILSKFAPLTAPQHSATQQLLQTVPAAAALALGRAAAALGDDSHGLVRRQTAGRAEAEGGARGRGAHGGGAQAAAAPRQPTGFSVEGQPPASGRSEARLVGRRGAGEGGGSHSASSADEASAGALGRSRQSSRAISEAELERAAAAAQQQQQQQPGRGRASSSVLRGPAAAVQWAHNYHQADH